MEHPWGTRWELRNPLGTWREHRGWRAPKSLVRPKLGPSYSTAEMWRTRGTLPAFSTKRGKGACWSSGIRIRMSDKPYSLSYSILHQNQPTSWLVHIRSTFGVGTSHGQPWTRLIHNGPNLGEATTFPHMVYSALFRHTYIRMVLFSRDSKNGVPKLSQFGLPGLWTFITSCLDLRLGWGLKQTCSSPRELSNGVSHSTCTHRDWVDSRLLVVGSQTTSLTSGLSFDHNLCYRCPNGSYEAILDIYTSRPYQQYKKHFKARCLTPAIELWVFGSLGGLQVPFSGMWVATSHFPQSGVATEGTKEKWKKSFPPPPLPKT